MAEEKREPGPESEPELSYERARDELADVVRRLEAGGLTLEESLSLWERGERLAAVCEEWLEGARARLSAALSAAPGPAQQGGPPNNGPERQGGAGGAPQNGGRPETPF